jgi:rubrerythrin
VRRNMGNIFAGSEVVQIGIQIEKNVRDFYSTLTKQSKNPKAVELFNYLAKEEEKHIKAFQGILEKTDKYEASGLDADEYYAYMNSLASEYVFTQKNKGEAIAKTVKTDKEAMNTGIGFEKDSIVFYEGIKRTVPDYDKKIVDELIVQEELHLKLLLELRNKL